MNKRLQALGVGASLLAVLGGAAILGPTVFAQSPSTPAATAAAASPSAYSAFVAKLATTLGITDPAKVDAAIRSSLKQMVDDRFTAGDISANEATALKAKIDAATDATGLLGLDDIAGNAGDTTNGDGQDSQSGDHQDSQSQNGDATGGNSSPGDQQDPSGNATGGNSSPGDQQDPSGNATGGNSSPGDQQGGDSGAEQNLMPAPSGNATGT